jgi:hypothetical protein
MCSEKEEGKKESKIQTLSADSSKNILKNTINKEVGSTLLMPNSKELVHVSITS